MFKKILAGVIAVAVAILAIRLIFWLMSVVFNVFMFGIFAVAVAAFAIPAYMYIRKALLK